MREFIIVLIKYSWRDQIQGDKMGEARDTYRDSRGAYSILVGKHKGKRTPGRHRRRGREIFERIPLKYYGKTCAGLIWLMIWTSVEPIWIWLMQIRDPQTDGDLLNKRGNISFSKRILLLEVYWLVGWFVTSPHYIASQGKWITNWLGYETKWSWPNLRYFPSIFVEEQGKITKRTVTTVDVHAEIRTRHFRNVTSWTSLNVKSQTQNWICDESEHNPTIRSTEDSRTS